ncbi:hypothetical protein PUNSTDRAFT_54080 [Punctularia strigosozonata HHB-11173 SS5]|uniref:uncharacterized protein n=1 Tax=Punctularia strigosozonata (strain HHB-11173) TaxID=741275 RepID=UPI0004417567|nr:uncharacterized protein PUNSTDRAFT_54080 [Punctularia strigosozonata HHB-11173 SS5]EIN06669.1 hypothetical protein PUNSTDRAFT_54080 [Punctularia strigosozonata HHB-11173 SS5]
MSTSDLHLDALDNDLWKEWELVAPNTWWRTLPELAHWGFPGTPYERASATFIAQAAKPPHRREELLCWCGHGQASPEGLPPPPDVTEAEICLKEGLPGTRSVESAVQLYEERVGIVGRAEDPESQQTSSSSASSAPALHLDDAPKSVDLDPSSSCWRAQVEALFDGIAADREREHQRRFSLSHHPSTSPFIAPSTSTSRITLTDLFSPHPRDASTPRPQRIRSYARVVSPELPRRKPSGSSSPSSSPSPGSIFSPTALDLSPATTTTSLFGSDDVSSRTSAFSASRSPSPKPKSLSPLPSRPASPAPTPVTPSIKTRLRRDAEGFYAPASRSPSVRNASLTRRSKSRGRGGRATTRDMVESMQRERARQSELEALSRKLDRFPDLSMVLLDPDRLSTTTAHREDNAAENEGDKDAENTEKTQTKAKGKAKEEGGQDGEYRSWRELSANMKDVFGDAMPGPGFDDDGDELEGDEAKAHHMTTQELVSSLFQTPRSSTMPLPPMDDTSPSSVSSRPRGMSIQSAACPLASSRGPRRLPDLQQASSSTSTARGEGWIEGPREGWLLETQARPHQPSGARTHTPQPTANPCMPHHLPQPSHAVGPRHHRAKSSGGGSVLSGRVPLSTKTPVQAVPTLPLPLPGMAYQSSPPAPFTPGPQYGYMPPPRYPYPPPQQPHLGYQMPPPPPPGYPVMYQYAPTGIIAIPVGPHGGPSPMMAIPVPVPPITGATGIRHAS